MRPSVANKSSRGHGELPTKMYVLLRDQIIRGRIKLGARMREVELAERYGVSRTPIREALARLENEGFLVADSGSRTQLTVAPIVASEVAELWAIMGALEGIAAAYAASMPAADRAELAAALEAANDDLIAAARIRPRDADQIFRCQTKFHTTFVERAAGSRLLSLYKIVRPHVERYEWQHGAQRDAEIERSAKEHRRMTAAIASGDPGAARLAAEDHWASAAKRTAAIIAKL